VAVSSFTILWCSLVRYIYNWKDKKPDNEDPNKKSDQTMVDYSLATIMMPTTLAGSQIGTYVLHSFPPILINGMLTLVLFLLGLQSAKKGWQLTKKENEALKKAAAASKVEEPNVEDVDPLNLNNIVEDKEPGTGDINMSKMLSSASVLTT